MELKSKLSIAVNYWECGWFDSHMDEVVATVGEDEEFLRIVSCMRPEFGHEPSVEFLLGQLALEREDRSDTDWISDLHDGNAVLALLAERKATSLTLADIEAMLATPAAYDSDIIIMVRVLHSL